MQIKKNKKALPSPAEETRKSTEARFIWATGAAWLEQHNPLYHVTESFQQSFDRIGRSHAEKAAGGSREGASDTQEDEETRVNTGEKRDDKQKEKKTPGQGPRGRAGDDRPWYGPGDYRYPLTKFSETAFRRGAMSASVLNGTGKMMLVSCLKRTAYESGPKHQQQNTVSGTGSITRNIPGQTPDKMVFNRGFADSALGIVVDTLRDSRRVVESMTAIARGVGEGSESDRAALFKLYPFLDDSRDKALESEYRAKLAECKDEREKPVLQNALVRTLELRAKKAQMKNEFINKLRFISDRATETLAELETEGTADELYALAFSEEAPDLPENPPDNPDEGAEGDAPNGKKNGADKAARRRTQTKPAGKKS